MKKTVNIAALIEGLLREDTPEAKTKVMDLIRMREKYIQGIEERFQKAEEEFGRITKGYKELFPEDFEEGGAGNEGE